MKLLHENLLGQNMILEASTDSTGRLFLEGPMVMCNAKNRNGRNYDLDTVGRPSVEAYNRDFIGEKRAMGELEHPSYPMPKLKEAAVFIPEPLKWNGNNAEGRMEVLKNVHGQTIRALAEAGYRIGVSTRGLGEVDGNTGNVKPGYMITAVDVVDKPSGQVCYMDAINESVDWVYTDAGIWVPESINGNTADRFINESKAIGDDEWVEKFKAVLNHLS